MKQLRIGIDCRFWGIEHAGLGRYTRELVLGMVKQAQNANVALVLFFQKGTGRKDKDQLGDSAIVEVDIPHYSLQEQLVLGRVFDREGLDLIHVPHFNVPIALKTPFVVTIHDLIKHFFKGRSVTTKALPVYWLKHWAYRGVIRQAVIASRHILVPSYFAKDQIMAHYPVTDEKITVTYEGVSGPYASKMLVPEKKRRQLLKKYHLKRPFFIYTGSAYPFKDLPTLLQALLSLQGRQPKLQLLIACARSIFWGRLKNEVSKLKLDPVVRLPGQVADEDLRGLYQEAIAFVTASLMEGFGLPGLEAMASGCPVIAARAGSLEEIYGRAASYFPPQDISALVRIMGEAVTMSKKERQKQIEGGKRQAHKYSWDKTARETLQIYQQTLRNLETVTK